MSAGSINDLLKREELRELQDLRVKIHVDPTARPQFCKVCPVPYDLQARVEEELQGLSVQ